MKKNQRKDIIDQITDLSKHRKSVEVPNANQHGISYIDKDPRIIDPNIPPHDTLIPWGVMSFYSDNDISLTTTDFEELSVRNLTTTTSKEIISLNGLSDININNGKYSRYATTIEVNHTLLSKLSFSGKCKAALYINGNLYLMHDYQGQTPAQLTTTSYTSYEFKRGTTYKIHILVQGNVANVDNGQVLLDGDVFKYIKSTSLEIVDPPTNVYASTNMPLSINLSWENKSGIVLSNGGTEIFVKSTDDVGSSYVFLDKVPYPTSYYVHSSEAGKQVLNSNPNFSLLNSTDTVVPIPSGDLGLLPNWYVTYDSNYVEVRSYDYTGLGYDRMLNFSTQAFNTIDLNNVESSTIASGGAPEDYVNNNSIRLDTSATNTITVKSTSPTNFATPPLVPILVVPWEFSGDVTNADFRILVNRAGSLSPDTTVSARDTVYKYTLSAADLVNYNTDPDNLKVSIYTSPLYTNGDTGGSILFKRPYIDLAGFLSNTTVSIETTEILYFIPDTVYTLEAVVSGIPNNNISAEIRYYDDLGALKQTDTVPNYNFTTTENGNWKTIKANFTATASQYSYMKVKFIFTMTYGDKQKSSYGVQSLNILTTNSRALSNGSRFSYILRNYTSNLLYSEFTDVVNGSTTVPSVNDINFAFDVFGNFGDELTTNYVGPFTALNLSIGLTMPPYEDPNVEVYSNTSNILNHIDLELIDSTNYDYTYYYNPLLANCVLYDNFHHDYDMYGTTVTANSVGTEDSPLHIDTKWNSPIYNVSLFNENNSLWGSNYPEFQYGITWTSFNNGSYKKYSIDKIPGFYRNILGNSDAASTAYLYKDPKNSRKLSFGLIIKIDAMATGAYQHGIAGAPGLLKCTISDLNNLVSTVKIYIQTTNYSGNVGDINGDIVATCGLRKDSKWHYIHCSVDLDKLDDPNYTYVMVSNTLGYEESYIPSTVTYLPGIQDTDTIWGNVGPTFYLGPRMTSDSASCAFSIDSFYLTANYTLKTHMEKSYVPMFGLGNPYYYALGYTPSAYEMNFHIDVKFPSKMNNTGTGDSFVTEYDTISKDIPVTMDFNTPNGSMLIMREAFTLTQDMIDNINEYEPQYTYTLANKVYVDCANAGAPMYRVRFSNDLLDWGVWTDFANRTLYPWSLSSSTTGQPEIKTVYFQVMTITGQTSDPWVYDNNDTITYDPGQTIGTLQSYNYVPNQSGWMLNMNGQLEVGSTIIRETNIILGKTFRPLKLADANIGTQVDATYYSPIVGIPWTAVPYGDVSYLASQPLDLGTGTIETGTVHMFNFNSHMAVDITSNEVFIPVRSSSNVLYVLAWNTETNAIQLLSAGNTVNYTTLDEYAQAHVGLSNKYIYTAGAYAIRKYNKETRTWIYTKTLSSSECISDLKVFITNSKEIRVAVSTVNKSTRTQMIHIFDENLYSTIDEFQLPAVTDTVYAAVNTGFDQKRYFVDSFDINADFLVYHVGYNVLVYSVNITGSIGNLYGGYSMDTIPKVMVGSLDGAATFGEPFGRFAYDDFPYHTLHAKTRVRPFDGIMLLGNKIFAFSKMGDCAYQRGYTKDEYTYTYGGYALLSIYSPSIITPTIFALYSDYLASESVFDYSYIGPYFKTGINRVPRMSTGFNSGTVGLMESLPWYRHPPYITTATPTDPAALNTTPGIGMCRPTVIGTSLLTALTAPIERTNYEYVPPSSSLYKFDFEGQGLADPVIFDIPATGSFTGMDNAIVDVYNDGKYTHYLKIYGYNGVYTLYYKKELA